jgi:CRISPR/Cas system-associated protein endoribonuclease Cas2
LPLFAIRRQADRLLYSFRVVSSEQAPVKTDQFFDLSIAAAQLPAKSKMTQSFEDFLIPSGYIKLHQVTSSCINQKKKAAHSKGKKKSSAGL